MRKDKIHEKTALDRHDEKIAHEFLARNVIPPIVHVPVGLCD